MKIQPLNFAAFLGCLTLVALLVTGCGQSDLTANVDSSAAANLDDNVTITQAAFDEAVAQTDRAVLVKFGAPWCPPCRRLDAELPQVAAELGDEVEILKINVDNNPELAQQFQVNAIPRMFLFRDGRLISDRMEYMNASAITDWIARTE